MRHCFVKADLTRVSPAKEVEGSHSGLWRQRSTGEARVQNSTFGPAADHEEHGELPYPLSGHGLHCVPRGAWVKSFVAPVDACQ